MSYVERLRSLNLFSISGRFLHADLMKYWKAFNGEADVGLSGMFELVRCERTRGHPLKLRVAHWQTDTFRGSYDNKPVSLWNSLPANVVLSPRLSEFKRGVFSCFVLFSLLLFSFIECVHLLHFLVPMQLALLVYLCISSTYFMF